jgi:hypothetical protein
MGVGLRYAKLLSVCATLLRVCLGFADRFQKPSNFREHFTSRIECGIVSTHSFWLILAGYHSLLVRIIQSHSRQLEPRAYSRIRKMKNQNIFVIPIATMVLL